jgi:ElaA protein
MVNIKKFHELSHLEIYKMLQIRSEVFVVEQECIYQDIDNKDLDAYHCFIENDQSEIIAYVRLLKKGVSYSNGCSIGRVLVNASYRHKGYATELMNTVIDFAFNVLKEDTIVISAQSYLIKFYAAFGFITTGQGYLEDGIPHIKMYLTANNFSNKLND